MIYTHSSESRLNRAAKTVNPCIIPTIRLAILVTVALVLVHELEGLLGLGALSSTLRCAVLGAGLALGAAGVALTYVIVHRQNSLARKIVHRVCVRLAQIRDWARGVGRTAANTKTEFFYMCMQLLRLLLLALQMAFAAVVFGAMVWGFVKMMNEVGPFAIPRLSPLGYLGVGVGFVLFGEDLANRVDELLEHLMNMTIIPFGMYVASVKTDRLLQRARVKASR